jgi:hypothetical protein
LRSRDGGLPDFAFAGVLKFFAGPGAAVRGEAIEMARRAAGIVRLFPFGFEPMKFFEAHENGVEGAGGERGLLGEGVAVMPLGGADEESFDEKKSLWRDAESEAHELSLHK